MPARRIQNASLLSVLAATALAEFIVYQAEDTYWRMQIPGNGQSTIGARVTEPNWDQDADAVTNTIANFFNGGGTNAPLWRNGGISSLLYYGVATAECVNIDLSIEPQGGLSANGNALSIILPSGVQALQRVSPDQSRLTGQESRATQGIFGIKGSLATTDYAYSTSDALKDSIQHMLEERAAYSNGVYAASIGLNAVRGDGVPVLIQLNLPGFEFTESVRPKPPQS